MQKVRKITLFLLFTAFLSPLRAQYIPLLTDTTVWAISPNFFGIFKESHIQSNNCNGHTLLGDYIVFNSCDTIINNLSYKKIFGNSYPNDFQNLYYYGAIRENINTKQVFLIDCNDSTEQILYDFNYLAGDSILLDFKDDGDNGFDDGYYHFDSVSVKNYLCGPRTTWYLSKRVNQWYSDQLTWVEGIGEIGHPFYLNGTTWGGSPYYYCGCYFLEAMVCQFKNWILQYENTCIQNSGLWNYRYDDCHYDIGGSVKDIQIHSFEIYPNPANQEFHIESQITQQLEIQNINGFIVREIKINVGHSVFDTSELPAGVYFIKNKNGSFIQKFVIIH